MAEPFDIDQGKTIREEELKRFLGGRYRLEEKVGEGGMGVVYKAYDTELEKHVAIKVLPDHLRQEPKAIEQLKREGKLAQGLKHPNIMGLYHFEPFEQNNQKIYAIICEYIPGKTLEEKQREKPDGKFNPEEAIKYISKACYALHYAHSQGIIHRDIKPSNIMVKDDGQVVVTDFGIAQVVRDSKTRTTGHIATGTLLYMSPEQIRGKKPDVRCDIYSLGITLYEMLHGEAPFTRGDITYQHLHEEPQPIEGIPDALNSVIQKALAKSPSERFASALEFKEALSGKRPIGKAKKDKPIRKFVSVGVKLFLIALLLVGLIGGVTILYRAHQQRKEGAKRQEQLTQSQLIAQEKQKKIAEYLGKGKEAFNADDFNQCTDWMEKVLELEPNHQGAKEFIDLAQIRLAAQVEQKQIAGKVTDYYARGKKAYEANNHQESIEWMEKVLGLQPDHQSAKDLLALAKKKKEEQERQKRIADYYTRSNVKYKDKKYRESISLLENVLGLDPNHQEARKLLELAKKEFAQQELENQIANYYAKGKEAFDSDDYDECIDWMKKVLRLEPSHQGADKLMKLAEKNLDEQENEKRMIADYYAHGEKAYDAEKYKECIAQMKKILELAPAHQRANKLIELARRNLAKQEKPQRQAKAIKDIHIIGQVETHGYALNVYVQDKLAFLADYGKGLHIIDISRPARPSIVSRVKIGNISDVYVKDDLAYVACSNLLGKDLKVIDIRNLQSPSIIGGVTINSLSQALHVQGHLAFLAGNQLLLKVIDISQPQSPKGIGEVDAWGQAKDVYVKDNLAIVASRSLIRKAIDVIDISQPKKPTIIGELKTPGEPHGVYVQGNLVFVADGEKGLQVIDISQPQRPRLIGSVDTPGDAYGVYVQGNLAFVADGSGGLQVIDISSPERPRFIGAVDTPDSARGVYVQGNFAFLADYRKGLQVIYISPLREWLK